NQRLKKKSCLPLCSLPETFSPSPGPGQLYGVVQKQGEQRGHLTSQKSQVGSSGIREHGKGTATRQGAYIIVMAVGACALCQAKPAWILGFRGSKLKNTWLKCKERQMQHGLGIEIPGFWSLSEPQFPFLRSEVVRLGHH
ncbi:unnamed protein product, partial [Gulo gulo]